MRARHETRAPSLIASLPLYIQTCPSASTNLHRKALRLSPIHIPLLRPRFHHLASCQPRPYLAVAAHAVLLLHAVAVAHYGSRHRRARTCFAASMAALAIASARRRSRLAPAHGAARRHPLPHLPHSAGARTLAPTALPRQRLAACMRSRARVVCTHHGGTNVSRWQRIALMRRTLSLVRGSRPPHRRSPRSEPACHPQGRQSTTV